MKRTRGYVQAGKVPAWMYFVKFENMSEDEAKAMQAEIEAAEAEKQQGGLFGEEQEKEYGSINYEYFGYLYNDSCVGDYQQIGK